MKSILTIKVKAPKLIPSKNRLHTYGTLEMGDVPKALFVMNAMPQEFPITYRFILQAPITGSRTGLSLYFRESLSDILR